MSKTPQFTKYLVSPLFSPGSTLCPVAAYELYVSKLNYKDNQLWQKPKRTENLKYNDHKWYCALPVGHDPLETFMCKLSIKLELSDLYTNHCIQATCMQVLDDAGFEARHIIALSSHKSESTVKKYATKCPDSKKREMCKTLQNQLPPLLKRSQSVNHQQALVLQQLQLTPSPLL